MTLSLRNIACGIFALVLSTSSLVAETVTVNNLDIDIDGDTSSIAALIANPGPFGELTLGEAIQAANNTPGNDTITFSVSGSIDLDTIFDSLSDNAGVTIEGNGQVTLDQFSTKGTPFVGITIASSNNVLDSLIIMGQSKGVVVQGDNNVIRGCLFGTNVTSSLSNSLAAIEIISGNNNRIGGLNPGDGNVISHTSSGPGLLIAGGATNTIVQGNIIGMNTTGTAALGNSGPGIHSLGQGTVIGGNSAAARNYISGNTTFGIHSVGLDAVISGNYVGTNKAGTAAVPNAGAGILAGGGSATIGGGGSNEGNFVCGNGAGITVNGVDGQNTVIYGNVIGLSPASLTPLGNTGNGISVFSSGGTHVGNAAIANSRNIIASNGNFGMTIEFSDGTLVESNIIGTDDSLTETFGNGSHGIQIFNSLNCRIGSTLGGANVIFNNGGAGIFLSTDGPTGNLLSGNHISNNVEEAIHYDFSFAVQAPVIQGLTPLFGTAVPGSTIEIFVDAEDEAKTFVDTVTTAPNGIFSYSGDLSNFAGLNITLTAIDGNNDTSPLSVPFPTSGADTDGDGLSDVDETDIHFTNPNLPDTDGDGIKDGREVLAGLDPLNPGDSQTDPDGDGLTNFDELNSTFTHIFNADTDGDGMADGYEALYRLLPRNETDALQDPDGDVLTNLDEHALRSNPRDANSPATTFFVDTNGIDSPGRGQRATPWQTITFALTQFTSTVDSQVRIILTEGEYPENVVMQPGLTIAGEFVIDGSPASIEGAGPVIVEGAQGAQLVNLAIAESGNLGKAPITLLRMANVAMTVDRVTIQGDSTRTATGIEVSGDAPANGVLSNSNISSLDFGIRITGGIPTIRKNIFSDIATNAILIQDITKSTPKDLGETDNPNSGFNTFGDTGQAAVSNETFNSVEMQNNDWGTDDPNAVADRVNGPAVVEPFLAKGAGILPASLTCSVWDSVSLAPITSASIDITGVVSLSSTSNTAGVYPFASLPEGDYVTGVSAIGFESSLPTPVSLGSGQIATQSFALAPAATGEDTDGDGLTDASETGEFGTNPNLKDTDGDGLNDDVEIAYGTDPNQIELDRTSDINADGDINAVDVQLVINGALGLPIVGNADVDRNGDINASDVQTVILIALDANKGNAVVKFIPINWPYHFRRP